MRFYRGLSIMIVVLAAAAGGARADVHGDRASAGPATRFVLLAIGMPDSLLRIESGEGNPLERLWERGELERLSGRIRPVSAVSSARRGPSYRPAYQFRIWPVPLFFRKSIGSRIHVNHHPTPHLPFQYLFSKLWHLRHRTVPVRCWQKA